ncbi:MATE family efflux transporter [Microbulbifer sp. CAU 1566]|uniref:MATE family efflux transporter n=1 Tax=Microbulbifer sp. CAU 1566 TaxID=2933269 RepID=UPI0020058801|nr:MATE family efflux transporter [Microbulbifer sp. CAU 1566]MCK7598110.1 MATE family efflux transporter [Microbulbifer sp. CAU 1566]
MKDSRAPSGLASAALSRRFAAPYLRVWHLAWPMILSNITVPLLGALDTAVLGHLPTPEYLSGVAIGASVISMLLWAFGFLRMGTTGLVARAAGTGAKWLLRALGLALALGLLLLLLASPLLPAIVQWMNASAESAPHARDYLQIRLLSAPLALANFALLGFFIGRQDSRAPLAILVSANLLNILLDLILILGLGMGARGAAWASVSADLCSFVLGWKLLGLRHRETRREMLAVLTAKDFWPWQRAAPWMELLRINRDLFIRTCLLLFTLTFFTAQGAAQGDTVLAANAILLQLLMMTSYALDGFAHATESLVGRAVGRGSMAQFTRTTTAAGVWALGSALLITVILLLGKNWILPLFTNIPAVLATIGEYYPWLCALPLVAVWSYQLDGVFIGAGKSRQMRDTMFIATVMVFLPCWWFSRQYGNTGIWFSLFLWFVARSAGLMVYFYNYTKNKYWL